MSTFHANVRCISGRAKPCRGWHRTIRTSPRSTTTSGAPGTAMTTDKEDGMARAPGPTTVAEAAGTRTARVARTTHLRPRRRAPTTTGTAGNGDEGASEQSDGSQRTDADAWSHQSWWGGSTWQPWGYGYGSYYGWESAGSNQTRPSTRGRPRY